LNGTSLRHQQRTIRYNYTQLGYISGQWAAANCAALPNANAGQYASITRIGAGTIFRLGEQKLNDFSVVEATIGESNSKYSLTLWKMYFSKKVYTQCTMGSGEFSRIFALKVKRILYYFSKAIEKSI